VNLPVDGAIHWTFIFAEPDGGVKPQAHFGANRGCKEWIACLLLPATERILVNADSLGIDH
jgi:hypothetical protein